MKRGNPGAGSSNDGGAGEKKDHRFNGQYSKTKMKRNIQRLGGRGLSLEAFANAKSRSNDYNPAFIISQSRLKSKGVRVNLSLSVGQKDELDSFGEKQREFYKNAKFVSKYKKSVRQQEQQIDPTMDIRQLKDIDETEEAVKVQLKNKKNKKDSARSLRELYEKKRGEEEKAKIEREASFQAKKEERQRAEARRKSLKEKMFKKTKSGQPVMKYRIEHLLETIQGSTS